LKTLCILAILVTVYANSFAEKINRSEIVLPSEYAVFIYTFEPDKKEFRCTYRNAPFKLEDLDGNNMIENLRDIRTAIEKMEKSLLDH